MSIKGNQEQSRQSKAVRGHQRAIKGNQGRSHLHAEDGEDRLDEEVDGKHIHDGRDRGDEGRDDHFHRFNATDEPQGAKGTEHAEGLEGGERLKDLNLTNHEYQY